MSRKSRDPLGARVVGRLHSLGRRIFPEGEVSREARRARGVATPGVPFGDDDGGAITAGERVRGVPRAHQPASLFISLLRPRGTKIEPAKGVPAPVAPPPEYGDGAVEARRGGPLVTVLRGAPAPRDGVAGGAERELRRALPGAVARQGRQRSRILHGEASSADGRRRSAAHRAARERRPHAAPAETD